VRHYATSQKVPGSTPKCRVLFFFFKLPNPSGRTMSLVSTQALTEISTRNIPWGVGKERPQRKADNITVISELIL
jgi:hypothetical protein